MPIVVLISFLNDLAAGTMAGLTVGSEATAVATADPKPRAKRPTAARKAIVISDSEDDVSDGELELDDR